MPRNLEIRLLRTYAAVVRYGSMVRAAHALYLTQSAVSQQLKRLETFLGHRLLQRDNDGLKLTADGARLLRHAEAMVELNDRFLVETTSRQKIERVRLGMPCDLVGRYMPAILKSLSTADPDIELSMHSGTSAELEALLLSGKIDLSVLEAPGDHAGATQLVSEQLVWVGSPAGQAHARRPLPLSLVSERCVFRDSVFGVLREHNISWVHRFEDGNLDAAMAAVAGDLAITACLESAVPSHLQTLPRDSELPALPRFSISLHHAPGTGSTAINQTTDSIRGAIRAA